MYITTSEEDFSSTHHQQLVVPSTASSSSSYSALFTTGPTNNQQIHLDVDRQQQQQQTITGQQQQQPTLSASFSFKSYQDIVCSNSAHTTCSTFSASDVRQTLSNNNYEPTSHRSRLRRQAQQPPLLSSGVAKFRVHSRHRSIGKLEELATVASVANWTPIEPPKLVTATHQSITRGSIYQEEEEEEDEQEEDQYEVSSRRNIIVNRRLREEYEPEHEEVEEQQQEAMSQTIQSIHSLSMQLNRAASQGEICGHEIMSSQSQAEMPANYGASEQQTSSSSPASKLSRLVGKKAARVKELLLQNLGKADKTTDELFQMYEENFYKQQSQALKLQKEFKSYVNSLKGAQEANKSLNSCIQQSTGDYQSARHDLVCENLSQLEHLNEDLMDKLRGQVLVSVNEYLSEFNELRDKIAKRRRKLIDYDSSRRVYELMLASVNKKRLQMQKLQQQPPHGSSRTFRSTFQLAGAQQGADSFQSATSQLVDEARLLKLREQYNYCKIMYETINSELHEELPMVYEKKMKHLLMTLQNYFSLEAQFHSNAGKLFATASDVIDELPMSMNQHHHHHHHSNSNSRHPRQSVGSSVAINNNTDVSVHRREDGADEYHNNNKTASNSSGMGSSHGDSSLESSSSPDASSNGSKSPAEDDDGRPTILVVEPQDEEDARANENGVNRDEDDEEEAVEEQMEVEVEQQQVVYGNDAVTTSVAGDADKPTVSQLHVAIAPMGEDFVCNEAGKGSAEGAIKMGVAVDGSQSVPEPSSICANVEDASTDCCPKIAANNDDDHSIQCKRVESVLQVDASGKDTMSQRDDEPNKIEQQVALKEVAGGSGTTTNESGKLVAGDGGGESGTGGDKHVVTRGERNCLYKVKTSYKYLAEDVDELCFEADEIIQVIEFDETQEQEEGWLMGIREVNGQRGLFPANFTRPI